MAEETINNSEVQSSDTNIETPDINLDEAGAPDATLNDDEQKSARFAKPSGKKSETLESALRRFKKQSMGVISEIRKREAYDKPSVKRKKKSKEARKRNKKFSYNR